MTLARKDFETGVLIVGGGAAATMAAFECAEAGVRVIHCAWINSVCANPRRRAARFAWEGQSGQFFPFTLAIRGLRS